MTSVPDEEVLDSPQTQPGAPGRIAALDGLRAVAVLAVMIHHTSLGFAPGGYLGVDIFFVLSGFLIAGILVDQFGRSGRIALGDFWLRRARRLAPALLLLLLIVGLARLAVPQPTAGQWRDDILAALTYTTNWYQIAIGGDYFQDFGAVSPLMHTWSLAVEEQFYLGFAVLLVLVLPRLRGRRLAMLFAVAALLSAGLMLILAASNPAWAYWSTLTRVQALFAGAGLAVIVRVAGVRWWRPGPTRIRSATGWLAVGVLVLLMVYPVPESSMYYGGFLLVALLAAAVIWSALAPGRLSRALSWRPLVALGTISYGVYLWHWPVFMWLLPKQTTTESLVRWGLWAAVLSVLAAAVSYVLLEKPVREGRFTRLRARRQWQIYAGAAAGIVVLALLPARAVPSDLELNWPGASDVPGRLFLGGDSTMLSLDYEFPRDRYPEVTAGGHTIIGCGLVIVPYSRVGDTVVNENCVGWPEDWRAARDAQDAQVAVVGSPVWDAFDRVVDGAVVSPGDPRFDEPYVQAFQQAVDEAGDSGRIPVYVLGIPCMAARIDTEILNDPARTGYLNGLVRGAVEGQPNVHFVDLRELTCDSQQRGIVIRDGRVLREDGVHWTKAGAEEVWSLLLSRMAADRAATPTMTP